VLAVLGVAVRALWNFLPVYPGGGAKAGFGPLIDLDAPALLWTANAVALTVLIVVTTVAVRLVRGSPRSRSIGGGMLIAVAAAVGSATLGTLLYSIEYVRQVGDFYDVDPVRTWISFALGLASSAALAAAGGFALAADRGTPAEVSPTLPAPPPMQP
jgi:hypothetical protein